ncbi:hypothetical protein D6T65_03680 [Arthrobacter frigidicola]|nr:hypothetical protein D6T65_03680 [Arthrobacter frigidicola]
MTPIEDRTAGGSEADQLEQQSPVAADGGEDDAGAGVFAVGNGGSEADLLEQSVDLPDDSDSEYPRDGDEE